MLLIILKDITDHLWQQVIKDAEAHLQLATQERSYYKEAVEKAKKVLQETFAEDGEVKLPSLSAPLLAASIDIISFDMAQVCNSRTVSYVTAHIIKHF